jgi:hypothetical protein
MNSNFRFARWFLLLAAPALAPLGAATPWNLKFAPAWLESKDTDSQSLAARFELGNNHSFFRGKFDGSFETSLKGTVMRRAADNPENLTAAADGIATWLWEQDLGAPPPAGTNTPSSEIKWPSLLLRLHGTARFEGDQAFDNTQVAIGPRVSFASVNNTGWWWIIPSLYLGYHRVEVIKSEQLRQIGEPERSFYRFDAYASWKWKPFAAITEAPALTHVGLHADLRYYRAFDMSAGAERASLHNAFYRAFDLSYDLTDRKWKYLREIYVRVARGRLPAATTDSRTISIGIVLVP